MKDKLFKGGYRVIPDSLAMWPDIHLHKRFNVAWLIFRYQNKKLGYSFVSQKRMRRALAADNRTITNAIDWLQAQKIIRIDTGKRGTSNRYFINWDTLNSNPMNAETFGMEGVVSPLLEVVSQLPPVGNQLPPVVSSLPASSSIPDVRIAIEEEESKTRSLSSSGGGKSAADSARLNPADGTATTTTTTKNGDQVSFIIKEESERTMTVNLCEDETEFAIHKKVEGQEVPTALPSPDDEFENCFKEKKSYSSEMFSQGQGTNQQERSDLSKSEKHGDIPAPGSEAALIGLLQGLSSESGSHPVEKILVDAFQKHRGCLPPKDFQTLACEMSKKCNQASYWREVVEEVFRYVNGNNKAGGPRNTFKLKYLSDLIFEAADRLPGPASSEVESLTPANLLTPDGWPILLNELSSRKPAAVAKDILKLCNDHDRKTLVECFVKNVWNAARFSEASELKDWVYDHLDLHKDADEYFKLYKEERQREAAMSRR